MSIRRIIAVTAVALTFAVPAHAEEGIGVNAQFAGSIFSSSEDPAQRGAPGAEQVNGECYYYGQLNRQGLMTFEFGGQAVATSTSQSQPELTALECTITSPAQGLPGERPTLSISTGLIGCPGPVCAIGGTVDNWPVRPVVVCISGYAEFGPFPLVRANIRVGCKTKPLV